MRSGATKQNERITNLDTVRGLATLGILVMNAVNFGISDSAYQNLDAGGSNNPFDWVIGIAGEIFVDQKTMALFSMLFGAGIVLFADRAVEKGRKPVLLSLWRNLLLLGFGLSHVMLWEGDILTLYACCAPVVLFFRKRSPRVLFSWGIGFFVLTILHGVITQDLVNSGETELGSFWSGDAPMGDEVSFWFLGDVACRALGCMLNGEALNRSGFISGKSERALYQKTIRWGLGFGLPLATAGVLWQALADYDPEVAIIGQLPNTVATIPLALAFLSIISLWDRRPSTPIHDRVRSVGQMAFTNYLTQTVFGVVVLSAIFDKGDLGRGGVALFILCVWCIQLVWSKLWLAHFRFGPAEWVWRTMTYRKYQPLRRTTQQETA